MSCRVLSCLVLKYPDSRPLSLRAECQKWQNETLIFILYWHSQNETHNVAVEECVAILQHLTAAHQSTHTELPLHLPASCHFTTNRSSDCLGGHSADQHFHGAYFIDSIAVSISLIQISGTCAGKATRRNGGELGSNAAASR